MCDVFVVAHPDVYADGFECADKLRQHGIQVKMAGALSLKSQMKKADKSGVKLTLIIGEDEVKSGLVSVKTMQTGEQSTQSLDEVLQLLGR